MPGQSWCSCTPAWALVLWLPTLAAATEGGDSLDHAVGEAVTVRLHSGTEYAGAMLVRLERDTQSGEVRRLRLKLPDGKNRTVGIQAVGAVMAEGRTLFESEPPEDAPRGGPRNRPTRAERRAAAEAERKKQAAEERRKWLARLEARGVQPWPEESDAEHQAAIDRAKKMIGEVQALLPTMQVYETEHFLFCSNMPPPQVAPYVRYLDAMHAWMCETYGIDPEARVWLGKATVFAFLEQEQFAAFEQRFFETNPEGVYGLCHQRSNGDVVISCFRGQDPDDFGQMLVHETSHGFVHRYQTKQPLPSWMNEGMAEFIGQAMVPGSRSVERKEQAALVRMRQQPTLGGDFFATNKSINGWQYGAASHMTRFLLNVDQPAYVRLINLLKEGVPFEQALGEAYSVTPEQLVAHYGRSIGVPNLRP